MGALSPVVARALAPVLEEEARRVQADVLRELAQDPTITRRLEDGARRPVRVNGAEYLRAGWSDDLSDHDAEPLGVGAAEFVHALRPLEYTIAPILPRGSIHALTALTNHGKTAISLTACVAAALGVPCGSLTFPRPQKGLILCGENVNGFRARMLATLELLGAEPADLDGVVRVVPQALGLHDHLERIKDEGAKLGAVDWVNVDTSAAYFSYEREDDNVQALAHARDMRELSRMDGEPGVLVNCHPTKNATSDALLPRGGSAFLNEIDGNLTCWLDGQVSTLSWQRKIRSDDFDPIPFEIERRVVTWSGVEFATVVARPMAEARVQELAQRNVEDENKLLWAMAREPTASIDHWRGLCGLASKSKVHRLLTRLAEDKLTRKYRGRWVLTEAGKKESEGIR